MRLRQRRLERVTLAQKEWTSRLRAEVRHGLARICGRLEMQLRALDRMLTEAETELSRTDGEDGVRVFLPPSDFNTYLHQPQVSRALWKRCADYLHEKVEQHGHGKHGATDRSLGNPRVARRDGEAAGGRLPRLGHHLIARPLAGTRHCPLSSVVR